MKQKKVLCAGLAAAMLMGLVPQTALAAENDILYYDFRTYDTDVSGDGWDWDADGRILTIDGLYVNADESNTHGRRCHLSAGGQHSLSGWGQ